MPKTTELRQRWWGAGARGKKGNLQGISAAFALTATADTVPAGFKSADTVPTRAFYRHGEKLSGKEKPLVLRGLIGARCKVRTCDPCRVKAVLYR